MGESRTTWRWVSGAVSLLVLLLRCVQLPVLNVRLGVDKRSKIRGRPHKRQLGSVSESTRDRAERQCPPATPTEIGSPCVVCISCQLGSVVPAELCGSVWSQLGSAGLSGASSAPTLETVSIWLSTGACCVPVTPPPLSDCCSLYDHIDLRYPQPHGMWQRRQKFVGYPTFCLTT